MRQFDQTSLSHSQSKGALPIGKAPDILSGGDEGIRTLGPHVANVMLSQLSYIPTKVCAFAQGSSLPDFETIVNRFA